MNGRVKSLYGCVNPPYGRWVDLVIKCLHLYDRMVPLEVVWQHFDQSGPSWSPYGRWATQLVVEVPYWSPDTCTGRPVQQWSPLLMQWSPKLVISSINGRPYCYSDHRFLLLGPFDSQF